MRKASCSKAATQWSARARRRNRTIESSRGQQRGHRVARAARGAYSARNSFTRFIQQFLNKYNRWNSPKYLFGESYGTTRSAVLANELASTASIDLNGVILLSTILNFDLSVDSPSFNPGVDTAYVTALPTMAGGRDAGSQSTPAGTRTPCPCRTTCPATTARDC